MKGIIFESSGHITPKIQSGVYQKCSVIERRLDETEFLLINTFSNLRVLTPVLLT